VRNVRRDGMDMLKRQEKDGDISKDEQKGMSDQIQKSTDSHVKEIDDLAEAKDKEIMQV
jgi:ribosome recycling factor